LFEIGVALTVFGGFSIVMETTAHPQQAHVAQEGQPLAPDSSADAADAGVELEES
jgi:hypothetical protein